MSTTSTLFIAAIFNLRIDSDLREGLLIWNNIKITNNRNQINSLLNPRLCDSIGQLETNAFKQVNSIFYAKTNQPINGSSHDEILCEYLAQCKVFLNDLWLVKDHCADLMLGFIQYPYVPESLNLSLPLTPIIVHSNFVTSGFTDSKGRHNHSTVFELQELKQAKEIFEDQNRVIVPFSESSKKPTLIENTAPRIQVGSAITQMARVQNDLGLKISLYCTALESLFTSDNMELSHKLAERLAFFLERDSEKRKTIYSQVKEIYTVRSQIVHGDGVKTKMENIADISANADELLRRVLLKIHANPDLDGYFRHKRNNDKFEAYMKNLILGS